MKKLIIIKTIVLFSVMILSACQNHKHEMAEEKNVIYTCSMDPQVREVKPGKCPICQMELTKTVIDEEKNIMILHLNEPQLLLANVHTDTFKVRSISQGKELTAITAVNENGTEQVSARVNGRIEKLYFKAQGEPVKKGDVLYEIYSEELLAAEQEYLLSLEKEKLFPGRSTLSESTKKKLSLWGLTNNQISHLVEMNQISALVSVISRTSGILWELNVTEGQYVNEGSAIMKIADLSTLWVEAQLYTSELEFGHEKSKAEISLSGFPYEKQKASIAFSNPELNPGTRINLIRFEITNRDGKYKPGMLAYVSLMNHEKKTLSVPVTALNYAGDYTSAWVQLEPGKFELRIVQIGIGTADSQEILSGLKEGEIVVTTGSYLLNSEYTFKNGITPSIAGMKM